MYSLYMLEDRLTEHLNTVDDEAQERMEVPMRLKYKCTKAALLAFLFAPTAEIMAVTHVPMFCPNMIGSALPVSYTHLRYP